MQGEGAERSYTSPNLNKVNKQREGERARETETERERGWTRERQCCRLVAIMLCEFLQHTNFKSTIAVERRAPTIKQTG